MPTINMCPDPLTPRSVFMFGFFDMNTATPESAVGLGEALLRCEQTDPTIITFFHPHHHAGATLAANAAFMFGSHAEQPPLTVPDAETMDLWPAEQT